MPIQIGDMTLYTVADLAEMLEVSESTITKYIREGMFKARKMGRKWYVPDYSIQEYFRTLVGGEEAARDETEESQEEPLSAPAPAAHEAAPESASPQPQEVEAPEVAVEDMEVEQLLKEIERLKQEAERLEKLYGEQGNDVPGEPGE